MMFEVCMFALLYTFIVIILLSVVTSAIIQSVIEKWFKEREAYVKRMSLIPDHDHDYERQNVN